MAHEHHAHAEMLDLDAEVARTELTALLDRVGELIGEHPVRHVLDLGTGTGPGTFALLKQFPDATVTAVDTSDDMLRHLGESARRHGLDSRIRVLRADLDEKWPDVEPADLIWASSSMHHLADPDRVLGEIRAALRPGGLLVMVEMEHLPRFLPDGPEADLEARCHAAAEAARNAHLPHIGSDWNARLTTAGFTVREQRTLDVHLPAPLPAPAARYARVTLQRFRAGVADRLSAEDLTALDRILAAVEHRDDLTVRSSRDVWICTPD